MRTQSDHGNPLEDHLPLRMGYFLAELGIMCANCPEIQYRGINRLPALEDFETQYRLSQMGKSEVWTLWESYWDAFDSERLNTDLVLASSLCDRFCASDIGTEVIYSELTNIPPTAELRQFSPEQWERLRDAFGRFERIHQELGSRPANLMFMGHDVTCPLPTFHSVLRQPGFQAGLPGMPSLLNNYGLIEDIEFARHVLDPLNRLSGTRPICVVTIWGVVD